MVKRKSGTEGVAPEPQANPTDDQPTDAADDARPSDPSTDVEDSHPETGARLYRPTSEMEATEAEVAAEPEPAAIDVAEPAASDAAELTEPVEAARDPAPEPEILSGGFWTRSDDPIVLNEPAPPEPAEPEREPETVLAAPPSISPEEVQDDQEADEEHHDEDASPSFAARALTYLMVLLVGAGLALWAAPNIAPRLPSGLAPVARWLTPGAVESAGQVAALSTQVEALSTQVAELAAEESTEAPGAEAISAQVEQAMREAREATAVELENMRATIADMDATGIRQQLARVEGTLQGQIAEVTAMKDQLTGGIAASSEQTEVAVAQIDVYRAELEGLRAEMATLSDTVTGLRSRVDEVAATAERSIARAEEQVTAVEAEAKGVQDQAAIEAEIAGLRAALAGAQPFQANAERLRAAGVAVPEALAAAAATGVPTVLTLREQFPAAAQEAVRASIVASADEGFLSRTQAYLKSQVATRSLTPKPGSSPDAVLSRMEDALRRDDLPAALAEADRLPSEAKAAMADWLAAAQARVAADAGLAELGAEPPATN